MVPNICDEFCECAYRDNGCAKPDVLEDLVSKVLQANRSWLTEVMEEVLKNEETKYLREHWLPRREGDLISAHAKSFSGGMEKYDLHQEEKNP